MSRDVWREFVCAPDRAGRHLSAIGRGVAGSKSEAIDLAVLQAFLDRLHDTSADVELLGAVVDLITGGYPTFAEKTLQKILDALSNEVLSLEQVVGPAMRGNPRWDRTLIARLSGALSPVQYVSRTSHRSFELPENQLLVWLVHDLRKAVTEIERRVGSSGLHPALIRVREGCEAALRHHWFGDLTIPLRPTGAMMAAASRHRRPEYRIAAKLAQRRIEIETPDDQARWYNILALLAVNWLEPVSDDDLFELYVLVLTLDLLAEEVGLGEPVEYGLVTRGRGYVALFQKEDLTVRVFFDQTPSAILKLKPRYAGVVNAHRGLTGGQRRPDIMLVSNVGNDQRIVLIEMKKSSDGRYLSDSVYKVFGYLYDFGHQIADKLRAVLVVPTGVAHHGTESLPAVVVASGDDRAGFSKAVKDALGL